MKLFFYLGSFKRCDEVRKGCREKEILTKKNRIKEEKRIDYYRMSNLMTGDN